MTTALLIGATGLIGSHVLQELLKNPTYTKITTWTRSPFESKGPHHLNQIVDFNLSKFFPDTKADALFIATGTTIKKAGSQEAFKKVDFSLPVQVASHVRKNGTKTCVLVSAVDASAQSKIFYSRVKGECEDAIIALGFESLYILRPSLLLGHRKEFRIGETLAEWPSRALGPVLRGSWSKYRPIEAYDVACSMVHLGLNVQPGVHIHHYSEILRHAN